MPQQQAPTFTPQVARNQAPPQTPFGGLSIGASSFTPAPRASKAIKISRPDGTALDFKKEAAALVAPKPTPSSSSSGPATPETPLNEGQLAEPTKKKTPALPIFVRLESEDQKKARIEDEARRERIRKELAMKKSERRRRSWKLSR